MKRVLVAFLIAPFPTAFVQAVFVALWPREGLGVTEHPQGMFLLMCLLFYAAEVVLALPLYLAMRKRLPRSVFAYGLAGALTMLLPVLVGLLATGAISHLSTYIVIYNLVLFGIGGFLAGLIFWRVAVRRNGTPYLEQTSA
jgi:hypothetical protein